jgi:ATP-dependent helicase Lhr and Lhr-like helicase
MLGDDLEAWMADSYLLKRTFRNCALIAGLIEKRHPGEEKSGRQVTVSTDLVYDVLRSHEPDHILLEATRADAATGLLDIARLGEMLFRVKGRIMHQRLTRVSPLAVPVMLQIGKEPVFGEAQNDILADAADALIREAMGEENSPRDAASGPALQPTGAEPGTGARRVSSRARPRTAGRAARHG